jgi:nitrate reductase molybdenum cofactor assembly chaperone NarJ/NarW
VKPWQLLSALLQYPVDELAEGHDELAAAAAPHPHIVGFLDAWTQPLVERRQAYVQAFDFDRRATLFLTYHTHGDRRQRGLELVRLKRRYAEAGFKLDGTELPDYLPVMLEFAALSPEKGEALLNEHRPALELVRARLHERGSPYAELLDALVAALPRATRAQLTAARRVAEEGPPTELVGMEPFTAGAA